MLDQSGIPQALELNPSGIPQEPACPGSAEEQDVELKPLYREDKLEESRSASLPARATLWPKDERLIAKGKSLYGYEFVKLWDGDYSGYTEGDSQDEADLALSNYLEDLTEGDAGEIDRLFRLSGLMRDKWDKVQDSDGRTHGQAIIELAKAGTREAVDPEAVEMQKAISMILDTGGSPVGIKREDLRHCDQMSTWFYWTGQRWQVDIERKKIRQYNADTLEAMHQEVAAAADKRGRGADDKYKITSMIYAIGACNFSEKKVDVIVPEDLDQDPMLFNCPNGTLDLRTGQLCPHRPEDLITKLSPVDYNSRCRLPPLEPFYGGGDGGEPGEDRLPPEVGGLLPHRRYPGAMPLRPVGPGGKRHDHLPGHPEGGDGSGLCLCRQPGTPLPIRIPIRGSA